MADDTPTPSDAQPAAGPGSSAGARAAAGAAGDNDAAIERTRAWTGLIAVAVGDTVIAVAAILGVVAVHNGSAGSSEVVSILSSAFTAVGTLTTAYFGIKATANTAKRSISSQQGGTGGSN